MADNLILTPLDESDLGKWRISVDSFISALKSEWLDSEYSLDDPCCKVVGSVLTNQESRIFFDFADSQQQLVIYKGGIQDGAIMAEWFRKLVPSHFSIFLLGGSDIAIEILPDMNKEEIQKKFDEAIFG